MFYSHQLLARKAPLGQIWMAATMHAKINRKKLNKLNIIKICEEILNPSVPMALRLSGILMGGVVIVYERKVKLLYDDVTRLLVEINEAWKVKSVPDPTLLPKGKTQAKYEAVTLPDNQESELGEIELSRSHPNTMMEFQQTAYFAMRLDNVDEPYIKMNLREEDPSEQHHQADADNITLFEPFSSHQTDINLSNRFERFDIGGGDDETQFNFVSHEHTDIPSTLIPSPPHQAQPPITDEILDQHPEDQANQQAEGEKEPKQNQQRRGPVKKKPRKPAALPMDYEQTIIPGPIYQSWLQNTSDIVSKGGRKRKRSSLVSTMKIANLMELPPTALIYGMIATDDHQIHYPKPLLDLWMRSAQPPHDSPSGKKSAPKPQEPSVSSLPNDPSGIPFEDFNSGFGSGSFGRPMEILRPTNIKDISTELGRELAKVQLATPGNSGDGGKSNHSIGSGPRSKSISEDNGRPNKKRPHSSSRHSGSNLGTVAEEDILWQHSSPNLKLGRVSELTPENDILIETGPTQTQYPIINLPGDHITETIGMQFKAYFDTPGSAQTESLNQLTHGMIRRRAAHLFYQTCVLATRDFVRVEQKFPYEDILISRGAKM